MYVLPEDRHESTKSSVTEIVKGKYLTGKNPRFSTFRGGHIKST